MNSDGVYSLEDAVKLVESVSLEIGLPIIRRNDDRYHLDAEYIREDTRRPVMLIVFGNMTEADNAARDLSSNQPGCDFAFYAEGGEGDEP